MVLFLRELKKNRKGFILWTTILILYNVMIFCVYPTLVKQSDTYAQMVQGMPQELLAAFNISTLDFTNILSFFAAYSYLYYLLSGSIYAMILGAGILSKEESEKTIEFLISKPITRTKIVTAKIACTFVYLFLFNLLFSISTFVLSEIFKNADYSFSALIWLSTGPLLVFYVFAAIGLLLSVFIVKTRSVYPIAIGSVMGAFVLGVMADISEKVNSFKYLSPFKYVNAADILAGKGIGSAYITTFIVVTTLSIAFTYITYNKKNITT